MVVWKDIVGYEGLYQVSDDGRVRSKDRITTGKRNRIVKGKILSAGTNTCGYLIVVLCKDGKTKTQKVHRLVAKAFIPNTDCKPYINHLDGNPKNNIVSNLEWCTQHENVQHAYDTKLHKPNRRLTHEQVELIRAQYKPHSRTSGTSALAKRFGVNQATIWNAIHKKNYL